MRNLQRFALATALSATVLGVMYANAALAADANTGKNLFRQQCALCHSAEPNDNGGAQGPNLQSVMGRKAASGSNYGYSKALTDSNLSWDAATLDRFLTAPTTVVPGSMMVIPVAKQDDRDNLIAYFQALHDGTFKVPAPRQFAGGGFPPPPPANANAPKGAQDWQNDKPGRLHRIDLSKLAAPFETQSASNFPQLIAKPANAELQVPKGFKVNVFATGLQAPRAMRVAANGDIFVVETQSGRIKVLHPSKDGSQVEKTDVFAQGLVQPYGMAFYPSGNKPQWLYVAEMNRVVRYAYKVGDVAAGNVPEVVVPELSPVGGGHYTRDLAFSLDGKRMFVSVGSQSNVAEGLSKKTADEIKTWEAEYGLGAAWGTETNRAAVLAFEVGSNKPGKIFATGIRNCVTLTVQPSNGEVWCTTNERDMLGDDLVPDYSTRVKEGAFYGWPWYYMGNHEDPRLKGHRPDLANKITVPDVPYQAHSAATGMAFYDASKGASLFPKEYRDQAFAVFHGSWNRAFRTGHKVVRVVMKNGVPTGEYEDFMVGFIVDGNSWGRPVAISVASDGSLLVSDDGANVIYRVSYSK